MIRHTYDYTIELRRVERDDDGKKTTHWDRREVTQARDLTEVKERLRVKDMDDLRYVTKTISEEKTCDCTENPCAKLHNDIPNNCSQMNHAPNLNDLDYQPSEPFWDEPETTRDPRRKTQNQLLPEIPARTIPEAPLRPKKNQNDDPLPLETVYINASQGRLF